MDHKEAAMTATTELRSYDDIRAVKAALTDAFDADSLTGTKLAEAIRAVDNAGYETIPQSVGLDWLGDKFDAIWRAHVVVDPYTGETTYDEEYQAKIDELTARLPDMTEVFFACLDVPYIVVVLQSKHFLALVEESRRLEFFEQAYARFHPNNYWVKTALALGLPREFLARQIITKLDGAVIDEKYGAPNFLKDFLEYGSGRSEFYGFPARVHLVEKHTEWTLLTDEELVRALEICIAKVPQTFLAWRGFNNAAALVEKLEARLSAQQVKALLRQAITTHGSLDYVGADVFGRLSLAARLQLISELPGNSLELLVRTTAELPPGDNDAFFKRHAYETVRRGWPTIVDQYVRLQPTLDKLDANLARMIRQVLEGNLKGTFLVGTIREGTHPKRGTQYQVRVGGKLYVQQDGSRDFVTVGDTVIFSPQSGRRLTPTVTAVTFQRVRKAPKKSA